MKFVATDGSVFTDRSLFRKYEMETQYTFRGEKHATLTKKPGQLQGQPFDIIDCHNCEILLLDNTDQVQIDNVSDCKVFIAASSGSVFVRNCKNCTFTIASKQLRVRDTTLCKFYLYCRTEPAIETSTGLKFAPFNGAYPGHRTAMIEADLDPAINKWHAVYDFNDPSETRENWSIVPVEEQDPLWRPLGEWAEPCIPRVSVPDAKRIAPPKNEEPPIEDAGANDITADDAVSPTLPPEDDESGPLHNIKVFGCHAWTIISDAFYSVQTFCLGLIFSGLQIPSKMISQ